jgi:transcriptional regulator with XRE-family HTH domain
MAEDLKQSFGKRVQQLRKLQKLTQEQLAEAAGLSVDSVSNIERGFSSTRIENVGALAKALKVSLPELFEFDPLHTHTPHTWKQSERLLKIIAKCPPDRLPALTKMIEQAIHLVTE